MLARKRKKGRDHLSSGSTYIDRVILYGGKASEATCPCRPSIETKAETALTLSIEESMHTLDKPALSDCLHTFLIGLYFGIFSFIQGLFICPHEPLLTHSSAPPHAGSNTASIVREMSLGSIKQVGQASEASGWVEGGKVPTKGENSRPQVGGSVLVARLLPKQ